MKCECEILFCHRPATARFTAPHLKPRHFVCDEHLEEQLKWAEPWRRTLGLVVVEAA